MNENDLTIDSYIEKFPKEVQQKLKELRNIIHATVPDATECIKYDMPTFKLHDKYLVCFAGWQKHIGLYATSYKTIQELGSEIEPYLEPKGTLKFMLDKDLPVSLIEKLTSAKEKEIEKEISLTES